MDPVRHLFALLLLPPITWAMHLQFTYFAHPQTCESPSRGMLWTVSLIAVSILFVNGVWSRRMMRSGRRDVDRFMAISALILSIFFALLVIGQTIPQFMLRPCDSSATSSWDGRKEIAADRYTLK